jgi:hypothetical protein
VTEEYLQTLLARRPDDQDIAELAAAWRKQTESVRRLQDHMLADMAAARAAGLTHANIREAVGEYADGEISFGRLVELVRTAAKALAETKQ